jgi:2-oxoglutarate ferredoxin oxidoreductase subunit delta
MVQGRIEIDTARCKGCGLCIPVCPQHVIHLSAELNPRGYHPAMLDDPNGHCTGCAVCAVVCPEAALTVYRRAVAPVKRPVAREAVLC